MKRASLVLSAALAALVACTSHDGGEPHAEHDAGAVGCKSDPRVPAFAAGMQAKSTSGRLVAQIVNASPSPPQRALGDAGVNAWTIQLALDGKPPAVTDIRIKTLMPDHGHGARVTPVVTANTDGTYLVSDLVLEMPGVWEITFSAGAVESATFTICIE